MKTSLRISYVAVSCVFLFSLVANSAFAEVIANIPSPFVDVPTDYDFKGAIQFLKDKKVVKGYPDQTYKPDTSVTRAEFLKMAIQLSGRSADVSGMKSPFSDVVPSDWFFNIVLTAHKLELAKGYANGKFGPNDPITRVQALKIAFMTMQLATSVAPKTLKDVSALYDTLPPDVSISHWAIPYVMTARKLFIMTDGDSDGMFRPDDVVNRGMAAEILYRISQVQLAKGAAFNITTEWNTYSAASLGITFKMPKTWDVVTDGSRVTVWKKDTAFPLDPDFVTPMAAKITFKVPVAETSTDAADFFAKVKTQSAAAYPNKELVYANMMIDGRPAMRVKVTSDNLENWYIFFSGNSPKSASIYGQYGVSTLTPKLRETMRAIAGTLVYTEGTGNGAFGVVDEKLRSDIQKNVLIQGSGKTTMNALDDSLILETDEIGVGTGPVDYYYSAKIDMTLKYERASDTILAVRIGKTTNF